MPLSMEQAEMLANSVCEEAVTSVRKEEIAILWGGMGRIYRVVAATAISDDFVFIVKYIDPTSKGCRLPMSDKRKLIESYENEATFYRLYSEELRTHGIRLPQSLHVELADATTKKKHFIVCMTALQEIPEEIAQLDRLHLTMEWLATFHATTWQRPFPENRQASFWHYDTRPSAWKLLSNQGWEGRLKQAAQPIHHFLKDKSTLQSWLHGDCKMENVLWNGNAGPSDPLLQQQQQHQVALCDYQFVGQGCPCKDLAYFLATQTDLLSQESLMEAYFQTLSSKLGSHFSISRPELDVALELAFCDYMRFLCVSPAPEHKTQKKKLLAKVESILGEIDGGDDLGSDEAYQDAINKFVAARMIRCE